MTPVPSDACLLPACNEYCMCQHSVLLPLRCLPIVTFSFFSCSSFVLIMVSLSPVFLSLSRRFRHQVSCISFNAIPILLNKSSRSLSTGCAVMETFMSPTNPTPRQTSTSKKLSMSLMPLQHSGRRMYIHENVSLRSLFAFDEALYLREA